MRRTNSLAIRPGLLFALVEQGMSALGMLLLNVVLFNTMEGAEYSTFVQLLAAAILYQSVFCGYVLEPALVSGSSVNAREQYYLLFSLTLAVTGVMLVAWVVVQLLAGRPSLVGPIFIVFANFNAFLVFQRKATNATSRQSIAAKAAVLSFAMMIAILFVLNSLEAFSVETIFGSLAVSSLLVLLVAFHVRPIAISVEKLKQLHEKHRDIGRWMVAASFLQWVPWNAAYLVLPYTSGAEASGELKALINLVMPLIQISFVLAFYLPPQLKQALDNTRDFNLGRLFFGVLTIYLAYSLLLLQWGDWIISGLYNKPLPFDTVTVTALCILCFLTLAQVSVQAIMRALHRQKYIFKSYAIAIPIGIGPMWLLTLFWGVTGAILSMVILFGVLVVSSICMLASDIRSWMR